MNPYDLETFVLELNTMFGEERPARAFVESAAESLRKFVGGSLFLDERTLRATKNAPARHKLYEDPRGKFSLISVSWPAGYSTPIHNHGTWGVIAGYRARLIVTTYRRNDDGTQEGLAQLTEVSRQLISEGGVAALVRPPEEEVHCVENPFRESAITVELYGEDKPWPHLFNPAESTLTVAGRPEQVD